MGQTLKVPGATLYYEVRGAGPVLLMVPGGPMDAGGFAGLADLMAPSFTVVTYDCRGNSRSTLDDGDQDLHVEAHADDARALLDAVGGGDPAYVLGSSGGATYALDLVARHPGVVRTLVAHEPPLMELLPDAARFRALTQEVGETYRSQGVFPALQKFGEGVGLDGPPPTQEMELPPDVIETMTRTMGNMELFVAKLIPLVSLFSPDVEALRTSTTKIVIDVGAESTDDQVAYRASCALADRLDSRPLVFPGDHGGFGMHAEAFARILSEVFD
jgi:pimeloyl-ACP methyl ester carboxylesterase